MFRRSLHIDTAADQGIDPEEAKQIAKYTIAAATEAV
jgi:hypothetical protein